ncbi:hypothetical protein NQ318_006905 [Aromia moschata]|uniref:Uncharacterized protein n=1 Tax=Aromia moschata TaxID=1265417 RepID=A0AAV8XLG1_9CUCU|nr:hypothetical protein NQ318_006905 [Aromia moschata]
MCGVETKVPFSLLKLLLVWIIVLVLSPTMSDTEARMEFCLWLQGMYLENPDFLQNILYLDEATFTTNGIVSSQYIRMWSENNPHWVIGCKRQYSSKTNFLSKVASKSQ